MTPCMTLGDLQKEFPTEDACLEYIFKTKYPSLTGFYRVKNRKCYSNVQGQQVYPLSKTIFAGSRTPLKLWFYAIYLFSVSKHGVSAAELQRHLGVTYKCAFRMCHKIRSLMTQPAEKLCGVVETDETYVGGLRRLNSWKKSKTPVMGIVERKGRVRAKAIDDMSYYSIIPFVEKNVRKGATLYTDGAKVYRELRPYYKRGRVLHSRKEYVKGNIHTNTIESFWSGLKNNIRSTYRGVSKQHLQKYIDEAVFTWNFSSSPFSELVKRL